MRTSPHPFTLRQLQYVVAVADHLSFRAAATAVHVSQPSLSAQVQEVEGQLGVVLFVRDKRKVALTQAGETFVRDVRALLAAADRLAEMGTRLADPFAGPMRIGVIPTLAPGIVGDVSSALRAARPKLQPRFREAQTAVVLQELQQHQLDLAVVARTEETAAAAFSVLEIGPDPFWGAVAVDHALAATGAASVDDLADAGLLLLEEGHCMREHALAACGVDAHVDHDFKATSLETLLALVASGRGVTLMPQTLKEGTQRRGDLALLPLRTGEHRALDVIWPKDAPNDACRREVAETIAAAVRATIQRAGAHG